VHSLHCLEANHREHSHTSLPPIEEDFPSKIEKMKWDGHHAPLNQGRLVGEDRAKGGGERGGT